MAFLSKFANTFLEHMTCRLATSHLVDKAIFLERKTRVLVGVAASVDHEAIGLGVQIAITLERKE